MEVTNIDNQGDAFKKEIKEFFVLSRVFLKEGFCPVKDLMAESMDKWSLFVLYHLGYYGHLRFNELKKRIDGISSRMLSVTLKKMEGNGIIDRKVYAESPPRVEYSLTPFGRDFGEKVIELSNWFVHHHHKSAPIAERHNNSSETD